MHYIYVVAGAWNFKVTDRSIGKFKKLKSGRDFLKFVIDYNYYLNLSNQLGLLLNYFRSGH